MFGLNDKDRKKVALEGVSFDLELSQELHKCHSRFDVHGFSKETTALNKMICLNKPSLCVRSLSTAKLEQVLALMNSRGTVLCLVTFSVFI